MNTKPLLRLHSLLQFSAFIFLLITTSACVTEQAELISITDFRELKVVKFHSPAIADNLIGEKADRLISVYLPPGYEVSEKEYPVVYYYPGFGQTPLFIHELTPILETYFTAHPADAFVLVGVDTHGKLGHSFARNSPITGRWEDFSAFEVPRLVERNFRVSRNRELNGIAGYSGGASAALHIGFSNADHYGAIFATSPATAPNDNPTDFIVSKRGIALELHLAVLAYEEVLEDGEFSTEALKAAEVTEAAVELVDLRNGKQWAENSVELLKRKSPVQPAIYIAYGDGEEDWLQQAARDFANVCENHGIEAELKVFHGTHSTYHLLQQMELNMLPFFVQAFSQARQ